MKLPRRQFLHLAAAAAALPAVSRKARAQSYPSRPARILVGFPAGGTTDIGARLMAQWLSERLGQQFVVENRPRAGTHAATEAVARAPADGYTLFMITLTNGINGIVRRIAVGPRLSGEALVRASRDRRPTRGARITAIEVASVCR